MRIISCSFLFYLKDFIMPKKPKLKTLHDFSKEEIDYILKLIHEEGYSIKTVSLRFKIKPSSLYRKINPIKKYLHDKPIEKILYSKISVFSKDKKTNTHKRLFTAEQLLNKIGPNPKCYLTGESIDLLNSSSYSLDHIIPRSRGGDNSLENCNICLRKINSMKTDLTLEEFYSNCAKVLEYKFL